jgi:hypothetical protein
MYTITNLPSRNLINSIGKTNRDVPKNKDVNVKFNYFKSGNIAQLTYSL